MGEVAVAADDGVLAPAAAAAPPELRGVSGAAALLLLLRVAPPAVAGLWSPSLCSPRSCQQERGQCGQGLILSFGKSVQHEKCHIFDAD